VHPESARGDRQAGGGREDVPNTTGAPAIDRGDRLLAIGHARLIGRRMHQRNTPGTATDRPSTLSASREQSDRLLTMERDQIVKAYWQHYRWAFSADADRQKAEQSVWAWEAVRQLIVGDAAEPINDSERLALLIALADAATDAAALGYLGAGPIEELLGRDEPPIDLVDTAARQNEKFRTALRCAWFDEHLPAAQAQRLRRFGPPL